MPRYVVLEHQWNGIHWDFMLEVGAILKTWAIDAPLRTGSDLPARKLADHRLVYLDYEGPISGNRGSVRRVDRGHFEPIRWTESRVMVRLSGGHWVGMAELSRKETGESEGVTGLWNFRFRNVA